MNSNGTCEKNFIFILKDGNERKLLSCAPKFSKFFYRVISQAYWFRQNLCLKYKSCYKHMYMWLLVVVHVHAFYNLQNIPTCFVAMCWPSAGVSLSFSAGGQNSIEQNFFFLKLSSWLLNQVGKNILSAGQFAQWMALDETPVTVHYSVHVWYIL